MICVDAVLHLKTGPGVVLDSLPVEVRIAIQDPGDLALLSKSDFDAALRLYRILPRRGDALVRRR